MNTRRLEAEVVRDSVFYTAGNLDLTRGGPDIACTLASDHAAAEHLLPARLRKANQVPGTVRRRERERMLPPQREHRAAAGAGAGQQRRVARSIATAGEAS